MASQIVEVKLPVPYYSQYRDVFDIDWQNRSCGIVCLKMVLDYYAKKKLIKLPNIDEMIQEGISVGGYGPHGWIHDFLVILAHNHGFIAYKEEFKSLDVDWKNKKFTNSEFSQELLEQGIFKIIFSIDNNQPVIVSAVKGFAELGKYHMVVITGYKKKNNQIQGFYYHDPDAQKENKNHQYVQLSTFKKYWRKLAVFIQNFTPIK